MADLIVNYLMTGAGVAVISDSLEVSVSAGNFTKGLNNFIIYTCNYIERYLIVECRSKANAESFLTLVKVGNEINFDGHTYYVKDPVTLVENWGEAGGAWAEASWRYNLTLVREE